MKKVVIFLLALFIPFISVKGFYCKYSDIAKYKGLASNINTYYDYEEKGNSITFSIKLVNLHKDLYIVDTNNNKRYDYKSQELTITGYYPGQTVKFSVYATDENCSNQILYTIRVVLPDYNKYYNDPVCQDVSNYIFCQKWYKHNLEHDSFVKKVNQYKDSLVKKPIIEDKTEVSGYSIFQMLLDFWIKYYYLFLIPIIIICSLIIYFVNKKNNIYK